VIEIKKHNMDAHGNECAFKIFDGKSQERRPLWRFRCKRQVNVKRVMKM
jgi:hypothetical protein